MWGDDDDADADRIAFNHLIDNLDEAVEENGKGEGVEKVRIFFYYIDFFFFFCLIFLARVIILPRI